jgi:predicted nucleic acid-binding protein
MSFVLADIPTTVLVDTCVVWLYLCDDRLARLYDPHLAHKTLCISFITLGELHRWATAYRFAPSHQLRLDTALRRYALLPADRSLARVWAEILRESQDQGWHIGHDAAWLAATARHYDIPLITHNPDPYRHVSGISVISER